MSIIFDLILIIAAVMIICRGYKKGLVKSIMGLATSVVAIIVTYAFSPVVSDYLFENVFLEKVSSGIEGTVSSVAKSAGGYDFAKMVTEMPEILSQMLQKYKVSESSLSDFVSVMGDDAGESGVQSVSRFIATPVATVISNVAAFIGVFIAALIVLKIVSALIALIFKAPVLKTLDKTAGLVLGIVNALIVVWVLSVVFVNGIDAMGSIAPSWFGENVVSNSFILKFFSEINPISFIANIVEYKG